MWLRKAVAMKVHAYEPGNPAAVTHPDTDGETRLRELVVIEAKEAVYQVGGTTVVDMDLTITEIFGEGPGHVIVHPCPEITVTVDYQGRSVKQEARPSERLSDIREKAVRELPLPPGQAVDLVLRLPGSTEELPEGSPVGAYVPRGDCSLTLDLVHATRPQG
jgi:hypothetical protein